MPVELRMLFFLGLLDFEALGVDLERHFSSRNTLDRAGSRQSAVHRGCGALVQIRLFRKA